MNVETVGFLHMHACMTQGPSFVAGLRICDSICARLIRKVHQPNSKKNASCSLNSGPQG
jgi:hypothetical protein